MKKFISMILTACICLSLLGGISIAGAEDTTTETATVEVFDGTYTYDFVPGIGQCSSDLINTQFWKVTDYTKSQFYFYEADELIEGYIDAHSKWDGTDTTAVYGMTYNNKAYSIDISGNSTRLLYVGSKYFRFKTNYVVGESDKFPANRWVAMKVNMSELPKGTYDITIADDGDDGDTSKYIRDSIFYFAPYDSAVTSAEEYMTDENILFTQTGQAHSAVIKDYSITSDATEYLLIIKITSQNEVRLGSITFNRKMDYEIKHSKDKPVIYNLTTKAFIQADLLDKDIEADEEAGIEANKGYSLTDLNLGDHSEIVNWDSVYGREMFMDTTKTAPWRIDYNKEVISVKESSDRVTDTFLRVDFYSKNYGNYDSDETAKTVGAYMVLRIFVPNSGTFDISMKGVKNSSGGSADVYIAKSKGSFYAPSDIGALKESAREKIGTFVTSVDSPSLLKENYSLEAGEYAVLFVPSTKLESETTAARNYISSITLTPTDDAEYTKAFSADDSKETTYKPSVTTVAYAKDGSDIGAIVSNKQNEDGSTYTLTAPETVGTNNEYKFLYWAKGLTTSDNRLVVSTDAVYDKYVPQNEANYLIAVYDKNGNTPKAEFYNANGQLIKTLEADDTAPALPYMPGYGQAANWALHGTTTKIASGDAVALSGNMIFFAEYNTEKPDTFEITVNGTKDTYTYGELVECKADATDADGNIFFGWKKTVNGGEAQLVSAEQNYTFYAWENCTVTPVYKKTTAILFEGAKRKILLGTFELGGEEAVMAEFIGFDDASEKGIILGTQEIAMTSDNNQFTVVNNNKATDIFGYAILDGMKYIFKK